MLMVGPDEARVERDLLSGSLLCPDCTGRLGPWGHGLKRKLRNGRDDVEIQPRRSRCNDCLVTHILLPATCLLRRRDLAEVIGQALLRKALQVGQRRIAAELQVPLSTLRGWIGRFGQRAELIRIHFTQLAVALGAAIGSLEPQSSPFADAVAAIVHAHQGAVKRFGPSKLWPFVSSATAGRLLNTSSHLPEPM